MSEPSYAIYLSGPMRGVENYNYDLFNDVARRLREVGKTVFNPAEAFGGDQSLPFATYMRADIAALLGSDTIVLLPGWVESEGARLEASVGLALGLEFALWDNEMRAAPFVPSADVKAVVAVGSPQPRPIVFASPEPITTWAEAETGLLQAADKIVNGDRQRTYGHPSTHHARTAKLWSAYFGADIRPQDISIAMILDKVSRMRGKNKPDNAVDIAGYSAVHAMVMAAQERGDC